MNEEESVRLLALSVETHGILMNHEHMLKVCEIEYLTKAEYEVIIAKYHPNKVRASIDYFHDVLMPVVKQWEKIRRENTEEYWNNAKMMGLDYRSFPEIGALQEAKVQFKKLWANKLNNFRKLKERVQNAEVAESVRQYIGGGGEGA